MMITAASCSSSSKSSPSTSSGSGAGKTYTIGVLTDLTGVLENTQHTVPDGIKAAVGMFNSEGYHLKYVVADTTSTPTGALAAAQQLVDRDHVFAVVAISGLTFAAAPFLKSKGIPVIGSQTDAGEWVTDRNMFSVFGTTDITSVQTTTGKILKLLGAKTFASIGYSISPSSADAAKASAVSAQLAGIKVGYLNTSFPFASTNVGPAVLAMKSAGVDSFIGELEQATSFAIIKGMRQQGVALKVPILATGFGGDLLSAGAATEQAAKGSYFLNEFEPVQMHTAATQRFANAMKTYAGVPSDYITFNDYLAYASIDAFVTGLKAAGAHPTQAQFINAMLGIRQYNAAGLYGKHTIGFAMDQRAIGGLGADNCSYVVQWDGKSFNLVSGAEPICGAQVPGKKV